MDEFTVEGFARACEDAMAATSDRQAAVHRLLEQALAEHDVASLVSALDASIPSGADIGEMICYASPALTLLYARVPARFQSGVHNHTVFACIAQLTGEEKSVLYERDGDGLQVVGDLLATTGTVIDLPADAIHHIENPTQATASALHCYGGDFGALQGDRSLWTVEHEERPFSFPALLRESARAMKLNHNQPGLDALIQAIPAAKTILESL